MKAPQPRTDEPLAGADRSVLTLPEKKLLIIASDLAVTGALALLALFLTARFSSFSGADLIPQAESIIVLGGLLLLAGYLNETLDIECLRNRGKFLKKWAQAWAVGVGIFAISYFLLAVPSGDEAAIGIKITRFAPIIFAVLLLFLLPLARLATGRLLGLKNGRRVCVVAGAGESAREFISLNSAQHGDWDIACIVDDDAQKLGRIVSGHKVAAKLADLPEITACCRASDIIFAINSPLEKDSLDGVMKCFEKGLEILTVAQAVERTCGRITIRSLGDKWLPGTFWAGTDRPLIQRVVKRVLDFSVALALLIVTLPAIIPVALLAAVTQGLPVLYRQKRIGRAGREFALFKLRTMRKDAEKDGPRWADKKDARITPFGRWLRRTRLDEVPQLWNVLKGDMSLVGPRPERPEFVRLLEDEIPFYRARLAAKPGITGWAQVKFGYAGDLNDARTKLEYDLYYIKHRSLWLDIVILLQTIRVVLAHRGR